MKHRNDFVHLHVHSHYSLLDGVARIEDLLEMAHRLQMPALALTDHGNLFGAVEFYSAAEKQGVKPIVGYESYVAPGSRFDRNARGIGDAAFHLTLLARNTDGYKNLLKLATTAFLDGFYYRPRIDKEYLAAHHEGLIALSGCQKSQINHYLMKGDVDKAVEIAGEMRDILGDDAFFVELQNNGTQEQRDLVAKALEVCKRSGVPPVATNDIHYLTREDAKAHDVILCLGTGKTLQDEQRMRMSANEYYFKTQDEMEKRFKDVPDAIRNTVAIAERCNLELAFDQKHFPVFTPPDKMTPRAFLKKSCEEGLAARFDGDPPQEYRDRLAYELDVIHKTGFDGYMLIVGDFVRFARERGIPVGPGRGSAVGSLICYTLGITALDPLKYGLIFERFMTPDRVSDPDIDIDFCMERREEVIAYVRDKYGEESVAQIITFGTLAARAAIRDVGRVMNIPLGRVDEIAKKIPPTLGIKLKQALDQEPELKEMYQNDPEVKELFDIGMRIEGICRHASTHAAGVVIADEPLTEYLPLYKSGDDVTTQYQNSSDQPILDKVGLLKMDFLGLRTLTIIHKCIALIRQTRGVDVDIETIPLDDKVAAEMLARGETKGVFQLESEGMTDLVQKLKPERFEDMIPLVALYRPGPLSSGMVDDFVKCKHGHKEVSFLHPALEPYLKETYGVILYQEQVMRVAIEIAGFTPTEADKLRKAMGKKIMELIKAFRKQFMDGAKEHGVDKKVAGQIFDLMEFFGGYGFNKSHSAAYGLVAYQTAYLKANYPAEFMAALMTCEMGNSDKVVEYISECGRMGIEVLPPSVNESNADFTVVNNAIRFGLAAVKGVGVKAVAGITGARDGGGPFATIFEFGQRVDLRQCNKAVIETLIKAGAMDCFGAKRAQMYAALDRILEAGSQAQKDRRSGQETLFAAFQQDEAFQEDSEKLPDVGEWPEAELMTNEKAALGFYLTNHPLTRYEDVIRKYSNVNALRLNLVKAGSEVCVGGLITSVRPRTDKKGKRMAFVTMEDLSGTFKAVAFSDAFAKYAHLLVEDAIVFMQGKVDQVGDSPSIRITGLIPVEEGDERLSTGVTIQLRAAGLEDEQLEQLKQVFIQHPGDRPVYMHLATREQGDVTIRADRALYVQPDGDLVRDIEAVLGEGHVRIDGAPELLPEATPT